MLPAMTFEPRPRVPMPDGGALSQDEVNLFLLSELERLNLLVESLQTRGVIRETDVALAQLRQEQKQAERRVRVAADRNDFASLQQAEQAVRDLQARIDKISAGA